MTNTGFKVGDRVRIAHIRREANCPADLETAYASCEGRVLTIKCVDEISKRRQKLGLPPRFYEFYIAHLTGCGTNRTSYLESLFLDDTEVIALRSRKKTKTDN